MLDTYIAFEGGWRLATAAEIRSQSIVNTSIPLSPEELSAQHMKQQENYAEFLTPPEEQ